MYASHLFNTLATAGPPKFAIHGHVEHGQSFVVVAVDPDAPSRQAPTFADVRHYLGGDFVGGKESHDTTPLVNKTAAISEWLQPGPPPGSGAHR